MKLGYRALLAVAGAALIYYVVAGPYGERPIVDSVTAHVTCPTLMDTNTAIYILMTGQGTPTKCSGESRQFSLHDMEAVGLFTAADGYNWGVYDVSNREGVTQALIRSPFRAKEKLPYIDISPEAIDRSMREYMEEHYGN